MSSVIQRLRLQLQNLAMLLLPLAAVMVMHLPAFTGCPEGGDAAKCFAMPAEGSEAAQVAETLVSTYTNTTVGFAHLRAQQTVPVALRHILPSGIQGCFAAAMLGFFISTHTTYLHTSAQRRIFPSVLLGCSSSHDALVSTGGAASSCRTS